MEGSVRGSTIIICTTISAMLLMSFSLTVDILTADWIAALPCLVAVLFGASALLGQLTIRNLDDSL